MTEKEEKRIWERANKKKIVPLSKGVHGREYGIPLHMPYVEKDSAATAYDVEDIYAVYRKKEEQHGFEFMMRERAELNKKTFSAYAFCILASVFLLFFCTKIFFVPIIVYFLIKRGNKKPQAFMNLYFYLRDCDYDNLNVVDKVILVSRIEFMSDLEKRKFLNPTDKEIQERCKPTEEEKEHMMSLMTY